MKVRRKNKNNLGLARLKKKMYKAFEETAKELDTAFQATISTPQYWAGFENRVTQRSNGETIVGAFRNIVDTSNLLQSQHLMLTKDNSVMNATFSWDGLGKTDVVGVFYGKRTEFGFIPGRDWVNGTLDEFDITEVYLSKFK